MEKELPMEKTIRERRRPIFCANCGTPMLCENKYVLVKDNVFVWYVCPRRKTSGEMGCGHKNSIKLKKREEKNVTDAVLNAEGISKVLFEKSVFEGEMRSTKDMPFIIRPEDSETFNNWLQKHIKDWTGKKVRIVIREV